MLIPAGVRHRVAWTDPERPTIWLAVHYGKCRRSATATPAHPPTRGQGMPATTERYRFVPWEIEDVDGIPRMLPGGYADVTRGGGMKYDQVVFLGPGGAAGAGLEANETNRACRPRLRARPPMIASSYR